MMNVSRRLWRRHLRYLFCSVACRFSRCWRIERGSHVGLVNYVVHGSGNSVTVEGRARLSHCSFMIAGSDNSITVRGGARIGYCWMSLTGDGHEIVVDGSSGSFALTMRGKGGRVAVGRHTTIEQCYMVCMGRGNSISIGDDCMFSGDTEIWSTDSHLITDAEGMPVNASRPVKIGDHVWVGKHAVVLKGVNVGEHAVIGMSAVVTKDVPAHSVVAGNPARIVHTDIDWHKGFIKE